MNEWDRDTIQPLLRSALPRAGGSELREDLWPRMLRRLERGPANWGGPDFILASLAAAGLLAFPEAISWVLFQL
jgi:hypothetical protein